MDRSHVEPDDRVHEGVGGVRQLLCGGTVPAAVERGLPPASPRGQHGGHPCRSVCREDLAGASGPAGPVERATSGFRQLDVRPVPPGCPARLPACGLQRDAGGRAAHLSGAHEATKSRQLASCGRTRTCSGGEGLPQHIWIGTSTENQKTAHRIRHLKQVPAAVRFLSCEPLIGPLSLCKVLGSGEIHWVIVGGESGPGWRRVDPGWVTTLRDECVAANVPFFFKQWGGRTPKAGGRELEGREWDQMPGWGAHPSVGTAGWNESVGIRAPSERSSI